MGGFDTSTTASTESAICIKQAPAPAPAPAPTAPAPAPAPAPATRAACENPGHPSFPSCTMPRAGTCNGQARLGYGNRWSAWRDVNGAFQCTNGFFGGDPAPGQAKECVCEATPQETRAQAPAPAPAPAPATRAACENP